MSKSSDLRWQKKHAWAVVVLLLALAAVGSDIIRATRNVQCGHWWWAKVDAMCAGWWLGIAVIYTLKIIDIRRKRDEL